MDDKINPSHYKQGKIETIDMIESATGDGFEGYLTGNIIKYVSRYKHKNGLEDLQKAKWHFDRLIAENMEKPEPVDELKELASCRNCVQREGEYCRLHERLVELKVSPCDFWKSENE